MKIIKSCVFVLIVITFIAWSCDDAEADPILPGDIPAIVMIGNSLDSLHLLIPYNDPGAIIKEANGRQDWENVFKATSGSVNPRIPGTYFLTYTAMDSKGKMLSPVTRTVHVVENSAGFLNGVYDVTCTCTAIRSGSSPTISITNYSATILPENERNQFRIIPVSIGAEYVSPGTVLLGDSIDGGYFSPDYYSATLSGRLSQSKNSFTLRSVAYLYSPATKYTCVTVYKRQLVLDRENPR